MKRTVRKMFRSVVSMFLALVTVITIFPLTVFASKSDTQDRIQTGLKGKVTDYSQDDLFAAVGRKKMSSTYLYIPHDDNWVYPKDKNGIASAIYVDINDDGAKELVAIGIDYNYVTNTTDNSHIELICFYSENNTIYTSIYYSPSVLPSGYLTFSYAFYCVNNYILCDYSFATGIEGSGSNWRECSALYSFSNGIWTLEEDFGSGVTYGTTHFFDNVHGIYVSDYEDSHYISDFDYDKYTASAYMNIVKRKYLVTAMNEYLFCKIGCLAKRNNGELSFECKYNDDLNYYTFSDIKKAYKFLLNVYYEPEKKLSYNDLNNYILYDIDKNGIPELIIKDGVVFGGHTYLFFSYNTRNKQIVKLGNVVSHHSTLCGIADESCLYIVETTQGTETINRITIQNNAVVDELYRSYEDLYNYIYPGTKLSMFNTNKTFPIDNIIINENSKVFDESKYIADIWLNLNRNNNTPESETIDIILSMNSISATIADALNKDSGFMNAVKCWKGLEIAADPTSAIDTFLLDKEKMYESLIFELLEKINVENDELYSNVILDAVNTAGSISEDVTKYKDILDGFLDSVGTTMKLDDLCTQLDSLDGKKTIKEFYNTWSKDYKSPLDSYSEFSDYIDGVLQVAKSVSEFYEGFLNYIMAVDMSYETVELLTEMKGKTTDQSFITALQNVINCYKKADYAGIMLGLDTGLGISKMIFKEVLKGVMKNIPFYEVFCEVYKAGKTVVNLVLNTDGCIDAYELCDATRTFVAVNKSVINSLAKEYKTTKSSSAASSYVYAIKTYKYINAIDLDSSLNFIKKAKKEGLVNFIANSTKTISNLLFGTDFKNSYDEFLKNSESIKQSMTTIFDNLIYSWIFDVEYLKSDYPDIYPIYATKVLSDKVYAPSIVSASIFENGSTVIRYLYNGYYKNENDEMIHLLPGACVLTGFEITENINGKYTKKETEYDFGESSVSFYNKDLTGVFPKKYSISAFEDDEDGSDRIYTASSEKILGNPCETPQLIPDFMMKNYISFHIHDETSRKFSNVKYHIYRRDDSSDFSEVDTITRSYRVSLSTSDLYTDKTAVANKRYYYYVVSELTFTDGTTIYSPKSSVISINGITDKYPDIRFNGAASNGRSIDNTSPYAMYSVVKYASETQDKGVMIEWDSVENADGYEIFRLASYASEYKTVCKVNGNITSYVDNSIDDGVDYTYFVVPYSMSNDIVCYDTSCIFSGDYNNPCDHNYTSKTVAPTCINNGYTIHTCSICGDVFKDTEVYSFGHTFGEWNIVIQATQEVEGLAERTCSVCGTSEIKIIDRVSSSISKGDVDGDGKITTKDARLALRISAKLESATAEMLYAADLDGNEKVTIAEARKILRVAAKLDVMQ